MRTKVLPHTPQGCRLDLAAVPAFDDDDDEQDVELDLVVVDLVEEGVARVRGVGLGSRAEVRDDDRLRAAAARRSRDMV